MTVQLHLLILPAIALIAVVTWAVAHARFKAMWRIRKGTRNPRWTLLDYNKDDLASWWVRGVSASVAGLLVLVTAIALVPFQPRYWVLTEHRGEIASVSNRFVDGTGDISGSTYTLNLVGDATPRVVTDSRVLGLEVGDRVDLTCSLEWVYGGADRSNCYLRSFETR